jgi:hypothetical protein
MPPTRCRSTAQGHGTAQRRTERYQLTAPTDRINVQECTQALSGATFGTKRAVGSSRPRDTFGWVAPARLAWTKATRSRSPRTPTATSALLRNVTSPANSWRSPRSVGPWSFDRDRHVERIVTEPAQPAEQVGEPLGGMTDRELDLDHAGRVEHTHRVRLGGPVDTDIQRRVRQREQHQRISSRRQRRLGEEADTRAVTDWRSTARPSVAGPQPRENRGRQCHAGPQRATATGRHPGPRRVPTTSTMPAPAARRVHQ